jgi:flavodoxin
MARILVVYYSLTGHTRQVAEAIAAECGADIDPIVTVKPGRMTFWTYFWGGWAALSKRSVAIRPEGKVPTNYDLVVLGGPNWAGHIPPPVRSYILENARSFKRLALFCTQGGANGERVLAQMAELSGHTPMARLLVSEPELDTDLGRAKVARFVADLANA